MLFGLRLANEIYPPWKNEYLNYEKLKKLLKESVIATSGEADQSWTEKDESSFVSFLDSELEKVYSFESARYTELSKRIQTIEDAVEKAENIDAKKIDAELEEILEIANQLDRFRRHNFTGFVKIVKKHDRLHPKYQVRPLLQVRLNALPFHSEDYSPLLYRLSALYSVLSENYGSTKNYPATASAVMSSFHRSSGYTTLRFWVHPENVMEVKTKILRHLPVLIYNRKSDEGDGEESNDPIVTSLYFDNPQFELYDAQLEKRKQSAADSSRPSMRLRWHGRLYEKPNIVLEQKFEDHAVRINLKEKHINEFIKGTPSVIERNVRKLNSRNLPSARIEAYESAATDLQSYIKENRLTPVMRTVYTRTAFEIPGDDAVRIILDNDITFIREDPFNSSSPIRDPDSWHRQDLDIPTLSDPFKVLRKSEYVKFPYAVLELRLKTSGDSKPAYGAWVDELTSSHLVTEVPHFSKFVQGIASLYAEDDTIQGLPFWLPELEHDIRRDPTEVYKRNRQLRNEAAQRKMSISSPIPSSGGTGALFAVDENEEDSSDGEGSSSGTNSALRRGSVGFPTLETHGPKLDMDSEEEEVELPPGVSKPTSYIKNQGAVKVETKVWLANERTFTRWLHVTTMLSALTFTLYNSVQRSVSQSLAEYVAYSLFALTIFSALWGYGTYLRRVRYIRERSEVHLDAPFGPIVIAFGLLFSLVLNFYSALQNRKSHIPASV